jgi:hypothetical protein
MLSSWAYKLDPSHYLRLYIHKVYQENFVPKELSILQQSLSVSKDGYSQHNSSIVGDSLDNKSILFGSLTPSMSGGTPSETAPSSIDPQDIIGLTVIEASPQYITKFNTLKSHLYMQDHPLVKILNLFREAIIKYLSDSHDGIK